MKVSLLVTCLGDALFPEAPVATVKLLRRLGLEVEFLPAQTCCGQPHFNSGFHDMARDIAKHTIKTFAAAPVIVTPSGSCAAMVKIEYPELFHDDPVWGPRARSLAERTFELSDFLVNFLKREDVGAHFVGRATYHMACHLRGLNIRDEPIRLLQKVEGLELLPLERSDECCGFGGSFSVRYGNISGAMVQDKASFVEKTGADYLIATDAGCLMNIGGCLKRRESKVRIVHLAEVLASQKIGEREG